MKLMYKLLLFPILFCVSFAAKAQMITSGVTRYGNEWINYSQEYLKIPIAADGIYRLSGDELSKNGFNIANIPSNQYKMYHLGKEIPVFINTANPLTASDFIEFFAKKNRSEVDSFLYRRAAQEMGNPKYSLFNDTSAYFLTWSAATPSKRFNVIANDLTNAPAKQEYFMHPLDVVFTDHFDKKYNQLVSEDELKSSQYVLTEGFTSEYAAERVVDLKPIDIFTAGPAAKLDIYAEWRNLLTVTTDTPKFHKTNILVNGKSLRKDSTFLGGAYGLKIFNIDLPLSEVKATTPVTIKSYGNNKDDHRIAYITLTYPRTFTFGESQTFTFNSDASATKQQFVIEKIKAGTVPILYDLTNQTKVVGTVTGTSAAFVLPASTTARNLVFYLDNSANSALVKKKVTFENYKNTAATYLIISNSRLYKDKSGKNWVQEYANYRNSAAGGNYKTSIIDIEQLYDQYAYGIERHAIAMRNFTNYAAKNWAPTHLFLLGRGVTYDEMRKMDAIENEAFFVPTHGFPGSDNLISANPSSSNPTLATGRIPAISGNDVRIYLEKVKTYEKERKEAAQTIEGRAWMKRVINLAGGDLKQQANALSSLKNMGYILSTNKFGADVTTFEKTSDQIVLGSNSDLLKSLINNGSSIVNFFGHSGENNLDYSIDPPRLLENKEKYFFFFAYGCYSGIAHGIAKGFGTSYVLEENKGAIAYIAPGQYGTTDALPAFGSTFNTHLGTTHYTKTIGEMMQATIKSFETSLVSSLISLQHQMTLQGDPALRFFYSPEPDFVFNPNAVKVTPSIVTAAQDSFKVSFNLANIGANNRDTLKIQLIREVNGKKIATIIDSLVYNLTTERTFTYKFAVGGKAGVGANKIYVTLDPKNKIKEGPLPDAESNNELVINGNKGFELTVLGNDVQPLYPQNYAIVNKNDITLKAVTANPFAKKQKYFMEIDTTERFNSAVKLQTIVEQSGGVIAWKPNLKLKDSMVYYWRITPDSTTKIGYVWRTSSFVYLEKGNQGWNQSHFYQFKNNDFATLNLTDLDRKFKYQDTKNNIPFLNGVYDGVFQPQAGIQNELAPNWLSAYFPGYYLSKSNTGVMIWINDGTSLKSIPNKYPGLYGSDYQNTGIPPGGWDDFCFPYNTNTPTERAKLLNFLENNVKKGDYVTLMTIQKDDQYNTYFPEQWAADSATLGKNIFQVLEKNGAKKVRTLAKQSKPYIFSYRKGDASFPATEVVADSVNQIIKFSLNMTSAWKNGNLASTLVGPAKEWSKVFWETKEVEAKDESLLTIKGILNNGKDSILFKNVTATETDISKIDAKVFPYLRLEWASADTLNRTAPQLKYWRVTHTGLPEAVLAPNKLFSFKADTLQQGDKLKLRFAAENVSDYSMDSLLIAYKIKKANNTEVVSYQRVKPLLTQDSLSASFTLDTKTYLGLNELSIRINPRKDQAERDTTNNLGILSFFVKKEQKHPLIDVVIDGNHIINGDIVSAKPNILISVKDENQFLFLDDTSLFKIYLRNDSSKTDKSAKLITFDNPMLKFYPASATNGNKASIELNPELVDGKYHLLVKAKDASGNKSIEYPLEGEKTGIPDYYNYQIAFEVITKSAISNILNYPNPFSTSTQFVYTLTGQEAPAYFKIQIMSISGRVVREITQQELGDLKIGTHKTDYAWDGTDQYGDQLASGVYFYKVIAKKANGDDFEGHANESADVFFKKGLGKMVILR
jgi:hypothetical protein